MTGLAADTSPTPLLASRVRVMNNQKSHFCMHCKVILLHFCFIIKKIAFIAIDKEWKPALVKQRKASYACNDGKPLSWKAG
jgi:hypothetical protein